MTYLILNTLFLVTLVLFLPKKLSRPSAAWWVTLGIIVLLTAIFDPIIVRLGIVGYDTSKILGITVLGAPVEDFFYAVFAVAIISLVWNRLGGQKK